MSFLVNPEKLELFSAQVQRAGVHAERADQYLLRDGYLDAYSQGMLGLLNDANRAVFELVSAELSRLGTLCGSSGRALHHAARYYRSTDHSAAERFDNAYEPLHDRSAYTHGEGE